MIENDNQFEEIEYVKNDKPLAELNREEILEAIKNAGVVGMGGAGFPTNVKLSPKNADEIDYIIVNASECEPYLTRSVFPHRSRTPTQTPAHGYLHVSGTHCDPHYPHRLPVDTGG